MKIEVQKDTLIVEENTKDSLQVKIENDTVVPENQIEVNGQLIKGDNLVVTDVEQVNLGNIKRRLIAIDEQIANLTAERENLVSTQALIEPELDKAITDILKNPGSEDRRAKEASPVEEVTLLSVEELPV